jgi:hypothetical protein
MSAVCIVTVQQARLPLFLLFHLWVSSVKSHESIEVDHVAVENVDKPELPTSSSYTSSYEKHPWIKKTGLGFFCSICRLHGSKQPGTKWSVVPLASNCSKKLYAKVAKHATSGMHKMSLIAESQSNAPGVLAQVVKSANAKQVGNSECIKGLFRTAYVMLANEIPHNTNWRAIVSTVAACDQSGILSSYIRKCPANGHHLSHTSITDILDAFGEAIQNDVKKRVAGTQLFSLMADECTDINRLEMVSVCIRKLEHAKISEIFIGCWPVKSTRAVDVTECILRALESVDLDPKNVASVAFDGVVNSRSSWSSWFITELNTEWNFIRRLDGDQTLPAAIMDFALSAEKRAMFPAFSMAAYRMLLLPLGTANVEMSFSTLNRILCSKRCRLNPENVRQLMLLSVEGITIPDVRDATADDEAAFNKLIDNAYALWLQKPRRVTAE